MSFGGSVGAMITSLKNNALPKRTKYFDRKFKESNFRKPYFKKASKLQIENVVFKMQEENRKQTMKSILALLISLVIIFLIVFVIINFVEIKIPDFLL